MKLLIVDDEKTTIQMLKKSIDFSEYGISVVDEAYDGLSAFEKIENYDIIFVDINMPKLDGLTMIERALKEKRVKAKFIIISAYSDFSLVKKAMKYGVYNYILKPIDIAEVKGELEKIQEEYSVSEFEKKPHQEIEEGKSSELVLAVKKYVDENYHKKLSLNILAKKFFINPIYLGQLLKNKLGIYFTGYLLKVRMERAKVLLATTEKRIIEIAQEVGYNDYDYFLISFEKYEGIKVTKYRELNKK